LFDAIFLDEVSMLPQDVFEHLWYHVLELPKRPIFARPATSPSSRLSIATCSCRPSVECSPRSSSW
jgi:hypothetical protein